MVASSYLYTAFCFTEINKLVFVGASAMFAQTPPEKFRSSLFKGSQGLGAAPRVATRKWRNSPIVSKGQER